MPKNITIIKIAIKLNSFDIMSNGRALNNIWKRLYFIYKNKVNSVNTYPIELQSTPNDVLIRNKLIDRWILFIPITFKIQTCLYYSIIDKDIIENNIKNVTIIIKKPKNEYIFFSKLIADIKTLLK